MTTTGTERIGDYVLFPPFATGGAATVHLGRLVRGVGFERLVVVKRLHARLASEAGAADRLLREARLASRVRSPYVVPTLDVVHAPGELCLVMEYVHGVTLGHLLELAAEQNKQLDPGVVVTIVGQVLRGLHAAHEATGEDGTPLELVHRDVSPQNVLVGIDGLARILDFGIAKALGHKDVTASTEIHGTLAYMAPEQLRGGVPVTRQVDIHAVGILLWEALTGMRLRPMTDVESLINAFAEDPAPPSARRPGLPPSLDAVALRALRRDPTDRFATAQAMLAELEAALPAASTDVVVGQLETIAFDELERLRELVARCERGGSGLPAEKPASSLPASGSLIAGKYRVGEVLGSGAMGIVLAAHDEQLDTPVAIKVLQAGRVGDDRAMARLFREAGAAQKLAGPHAVRVLDVGTEASFAYFVMDRLHGVDLRALLATQRRLPIGVAVLYALHACDALIEAHALGIVHRDLKPANLFLSTSADGRPWLRVLDFGIAKETHGDDGEEASLTATADVLGSPAYMSPEQIRSPKNVDARADVWALAVVLYELLAGALPFRGETSAAILASVSADGWIPIGAIRDDVPPELSLVLERCFAKRPSDRTPSMLVLAAELLPFAPPDYVPDPRLLQAAHALHASRARASAAPPPPPALPLPLPLPVTHPSTAPLPSRRPRSTVALVLGMAGGAFVLVGVAGVGFATRVHRTPHSTASAVAETPTPTPPASPTTALSGTPTTAAATPAPTATATPAAAVAAAPAPTGRRSLPRGRPTGRVPAHETAEPVPSAAPPAPPSAPKLGPTAEFR